MEEKKNSETGDTNPKYCHMGPQILYIVGALELQTPGSKSGMYIYQLRLHLVSLNIKTPVIVDLGNLLWYWPRYLFDGYKPSYSENGIILEIYLICLARNFNLYFLCSSFEGRKPEKKEKIWGMEILLKWGLLEDKQKIEGINNMGK